MFTARGASGDLVESQGVVGEQRVGSAGELEVVADVGPCLLGGHGRHGEAQGDALVDGRSATCVYRDVFCNQDTSAA